MVFDDDEDFSDDGFVEDMEALKKACLLAGKDSDDLQPIADGHVTGADDVTLSGTDAYDDDLELVRSIQERFALSTELREPITLQPLRSLPPPGDDDDDFETLRGIQLRFAAYDDDTEKGRKESLVDTFEQVGVTNITSEKETSNNLFVERTNAEEGFPACVDETIQIPEGCTNDIEWHDSGAETTVVSVISVRFPKSAQAFVDAIKKNRSCQKIIRDKMMQVEARLEELKKLKERVKILKGFQLASKKRMGRALSQKSDARVQLISLPKQRFTAKGKKLSAIRYGPPENSHVASFREALTHFAVSLSRKEWSKEDRENLAKGVKQQFQEMLLQRSVNLLSNEDGCSRESGELDGLIASIRDHVITPETMRLFLPKVNWDQVASMYLPGRSGAECQSRWLNWEDPLIKHEEWNPLEEKNLLHAVQQKRLSNWIDISTSVGVCRTPFQCLSHYQRSLNASIIRREWTEEEDIRLCAAVETFGESNWQIVASVIEGRTGTQCSNRWIKSLHPARKRKGKWSDDENKRLKVAMMLSHPTSWRNIGQSVPRRNPIWKKVAQYVPGRHHVQCRERWVNSLDPSVKLDQWTKEEDLKLKSAIDEHGYSWSKVAACVHPRTDNQCRRRWQALFPDEVPMLQEAKKIRREAFISNFVDREEERPALRPNDIVPTHKLSYRAGCETSSANKKRKLRPRAARDDTAPRCDAICEMEKRQSEGSEVPESSDLLNCSSLSSRDQEIERILDDKEAFEQGYHNATMNKRPSKLHRRKAKSFTPNDKILEASASSKAESTVADGNVCKRRKRTSSVVKKSRTTASQENSSSLPNLSSSMIVVEEAESLVQVSRKAKNIMDKCHFTRSHFDKGKADLDVGKNHVGENASTTGLCTDENATQLEASAIPGTLKGENAEASGCHKLNKCNQLKNNDRSCIDNLPETADDCMTLASFIHKSRAKRCSLSSTKVAKLQPDKGQNKAMAEDHSSRSCISGGHDGVENSTTQECTSSIQISGAEVGDDIPLSLFIGRMKRRQR